MNSYVIALGSNLGDRLAHLNQALRLLNDLGSVVRLAPALENPPLLPPGAPSSWYQFFLNTALVLESSLSPTELLAATKKIELELGRSPDHATWSPRSIDIDLLFELGGLEIHSVDLTLPHPQWSRRNFVLAPLSHILPEHQDTLARYRRETQKLPAFMGIVNVTPDSFSQTYDDKIPYVDIFKNVKDHFEHGTAYIDIGAESTRPKAKPLTASEEWARLLPVLNLTKELKQQNPFVKISIDTYHAETAQKALAFDVDTLNDVSGFSDPAMREVARDYKSVITMHSLSVPTSKDQVWSEGTDVVGAMSEWIEAQLKNLAHLKTEQIFWDPGFGFGKTALQNLQLVQNFAQFQKFPIRSVVGHSRKSFLNLWTNKAFSERDFETLALSNLLLKRGADILRVHNVAAHRDYFKSYGAGDSQVYAQL